jgi:enhancer of mRNA-decapping protein 4
MKNATGESRIYSVKAVFYNWMSIYLLCFSAVGTNNGVVRVVNRESSERSLLRGMEGMIQDIAFAHIPTEVILAFVDEYGNLLVHQIEEAKKKMMYP